MYSLNKRDTEQPPATEEELLSYSARSCHPPCSAPVSGGARAAWRAHCPSCWSAVGWVPPRHHHPRSWAATCSCWGSQPWGRRAGSAHRRSLSAAVLKDVPAVHSGYLGAEGSGLLITLERTHSGRCEGKDFLLLCSDRLNYLVVLQTAQSQKPAAARGCETEASAPASSRPASARACCSS